MELTRTQILAGDYKYPTDFIKLKPTRHFMGRLEERGMGIDCMPTMIRVSKDNIHSAKTEDGEKLNSVVVRIRYSSTQWLFICMNPYDGGAKTLWFKRRQKRKGAQ
jgi:hypothetical protein